MEGAKAVAGLVIQERPHRSKSYAFVKKEAVEGRRPSS